jgi:hypothetical protein
MSEGMDAEGGVDGPGPDGLRAEGAPGDGGRSGRYAAGAGGAIGRTCGVRDVGDALTGWALATGSGHADLLLNRSVMDSAVAGGVGERDGWAEPNHRSYSRSSSSMVGSLGDPTAGG